MGGSGGAVGGILGAAVAQATTSKRSFRWRAWLPQFWHFPIAFFVDMLCLAAFCPGVVLFMYDENTVEVALGYVVKTDSFLAVFNTFSMLGGITGRWLSYRLRSRHPLMYNPLSLAGIALILLRQPLVAPFGVFLVQLGDGLIYGTISRDVDARIPKDFNLAAISYWLILGDLGGVAGSNLIAYIRELVK